ncbi:MAG: DUF177 domain-containing protein [Alphaproteobacteria bacterium]
MLDQQAEFSRIIATDGLDASGVVHEIEASVDERTALARRFGLKSLDGLTATVQLKPVGGGMVRVDGRFIADVVQTCVVTLEPVAAHIADSFTVDYSPEAEDGSRREVIIAVDAEDPPEPLVDRKIDIGEAVAQHLALVLDPYPRAPGATIESTVDDRSAKPDSADASGPFSALAALKNRQG